MDRGSLRVLVTQPAALPNGTRRAPHTWTRSTFCLCSHKRTTTVKPILYLTSSKTQKGEPYDAFRESSRTRYAPDREQGRIQSITFEKTQKHHETTWERPTRHRRTPLHRSPYFNMYHYNPIRLFCAPILEKCAAVPPPPRPAGVGGCL